MKSLKFILALAASITMIFGAAYCVSAEETVSTENTENPENTESGWMIEADGKKYYISENGEFLTGYQIIDDKEYYFAKSGVMKSGWYTVDDVRMFFSTETGERQLGFINHNNNLYYADESGKKTGMCNIEEKSYCFDEYGIMKQGWFEYDDSKYYSTPEDGIYKGQAEIDDVLYNFSSKGRFKYGWQSIGNLRVFYDYETASPKYGWIYYNGNIYYADETTGKYIGENVIDNVVYSFSEKGSLETGFVEFFDGTRYYDKDGKIAVGLKNIDDKTYYFNIEGVMLTGFQKISGKTYYFDNEGVMLTGFQEINGSTYYFNDKGEMLTGFQKIDDNTYYFNDKGVMLTGLQKIEGKEYIFNEKGVLYTNTRIDDYRIDENGIATKIIYPLADEVLEECGRKLENAFDWCVNTLTYYSHLTHSDMYASPDVGTDWYAEFGFKNKKGNCYVYAATFCQLARELGYEAYQISGTVPLSDGSEGPHSWVEIIIDGLTYCFDTEACWQYKQSNTDYNGYMFKYGDKGTWMYKFIEKMKD